MDLKKPRSPGAFDLQTAFIRERIELILPDDQVIQYSDFQQFAGFDQLFGDLDVGFAGGDQSRGVVMTQDDRAGMKLQGKLEDLLGIHHGAGDTAL